MVRLKGFNAQAFKKLKIWRAFVKSIKDFFAKTAIHSYHYLVEPNRHFAERTMWATWHLTMTIGAMYIMLFAWSRFTENPTITTLESQHYSVLNMQFPAVGICPNNKISRRYAEQYAETLMKSRSMPRRYRNIDRLTRLVRFMGRLYDADLEGIDEFLSFQDILDEVDSNKTSGSFDARDKLRLIAPKCDDLLVRCKWGGAPFNCSDMIDFRLTSEGFCCTFNYVRPTGDNDTAKRKALLPVGIGSDMGLTVLLNLSAEDYYYPLRKYIGATALIFDPDEFADAETGGVRQVPIEPFNEVRVTINVKTKIADEQVQSYSVAKRGCMFANDLIEEFKGKYEYGDCLLKCKLRSVIALCRCKPNNIPTDFTDINVDEFSFCSLANIQCLNKYKIKWQTYRPRELIKGLEREFEDSLNCENCYPMCSSSTYSVDSTKTQLNFYFDNKEAVIANMTESKDLAVLKVYFPQADSTLYSTTVLYAWYDIVSDYGGILSLCLGCSIISFIEVAYFLTFKFYQNLFSSLTFIGKFSQKQKANVFEAGRKLYRSKFDYIFLCTFAFRFYDQPQVR